MWGALIVLDRLQTDFEVGHWGDLPDSISQAEVNCTVRLTIRGMPPLPLLRFHPPAINTLHLSADLLFSPLTFSGFLTFWLKFYLGTLSGLLFSYPLHLPSIPLISITILKYLRSLHQALCLMLLLQQLQELCFTRLSIISWYAFSIQCWSDLRYPILLLRALFYIVMKL